MTVRLFRACLETQGIGIFFPLDLESIYLYEYLLKSKVDLRKLFGQYNLYIFSRSSSKLAQTKYVEFTICFYTYSLSMKFEMVGWFQVPKSTTYIPSYERGKSSSAKKLTPV
jgi:hypothetical protein